MSKLWGSRFEKGTDPLADSFTYSIAIDYKLAKYDVIGSIAHARMLGQCSIIPKTDSAKLIKGLKIILSSIEKGQFKPDPSAEDIHTQIQEMLKKKIGQAADKLHTARSRNDLVVTDVRLYLKEEIPELIRILSGVQKSFVTLAQKNKDVIIPGYTHLQSAQLVLFSHYLLAYVEMFERDKSRLQDALRRLNILPLGSGALSGSTLPIDRKAVAKELKFNDISRNSMDAVSDRDFIIETLSALSIIAMHLSRLSEEWITWCSQEFNYLEIDWAYCTGSSIMPHKKNPDVLELIRGETGRIYARLQEVLILLKGLPLTYNRDLQLDKAPLFESIERVGGMLELTKRMTQGLKIKKDILALTTEDECFLSVDIMEYLITQGVSYREAHDAVGKLIKDTLDKGIKIIDLDEKALKKYSPKMDKMIKTFLNAETSVRRKKSFGSTNPVLVKKQIQFWQKRLKGH